MFTEFSTDKEFTNIFALNRILYFEANKKKQKAATNLAAKY